MTTKPTDIELVDTLEAVVRSMIGVPTIPVVLDFNWSEWERILAMARHGIVLRLIDESEVPPVRILAKAIVSKGMQCNCDYDKWEPEQYSGHTFVCRVHKAAMKEHAVLARNLKED